MVKKITAITGSYRKNGIINLMIDTILASAERYGAETKKIYLIDKHIEFCTNCRKCTQAPGPGHGICIHNDDMEEILAEIESSDAIILGAPVNFFNITAVTKRFMERLAVFAYWPWGQHGPKMRNPEKIKKSIILTSSAMPAFLGRILTGSIRSLKIISKILGFKPVETIFIGAIAGREKARLPEKIIRKLNNTGHKLAN